MRVEFTDAEIEALKEALDFLVAAKGDFDVTSLASALQKIDNKPPAPKAPSPSEEKHIADLVSRFSEGEIPALSESDREHIRMLAGKNLPYRSAEATFVLAKIAFREIDKDSLNVNALVTGPYGDTVSILDLEFIEGSATNLNQNHWEPAKYGAVFSVTVQDLENSKSPFEVLAFVGLSKTGGGHAPFSLYCFQVESAGKLEAKASQSFSM
jgi:hypothetical protein